jgi:cell division protein FtsW (lipid II flippase)
MEKNLLPDGNEKVPPNRDTFWKMLLLKWVTLPLLAVVAFFVILLLGIAIFCKESRLKKITNFFNKLSIPLERILKAR